MRHHDHRVLALELAHEILDLGGGDGVERAGGLVHQQHFRAHRQRARDAQALLLAAGEPERVLLQTILHLVPDGGVAQALFHDGVQILALLDAVRARAERHVVVHAHREGVGLLKHHAYATAQAVHVDGAVRILAVQRDLALDAAALHEVVHAVEAFQQRGLAAARRADERRHLVLGELKVDALQRMEILVVQIEVAHAHLDGRVGGRLLLDATVGRLALRLGHIGSRGVLGRSGSLERDVSHRCLPCSSSWRRTWPGGSEAPP